MKAKPPVWQLPAIIGGIVIGLGATGTGIVKLAKFLTITDRVEAGETKNAEQDSEIDKLTAIQETWQQIYQQQQAPNQMRRIPSPPQDTMEYWRDPSDGSLWCCDVTQDDCRLNDPWYRCE